MEDLKQSIANSNLIYAAVRNFPNPVLIEDESLNDSDKTFVVPSGKIWEVLWIFVEYTSSGDVGDRQFAVRILDPDDDVIAEFFANITQGASESLNYRCI